MPRASRRDHDRTRLTPSSHPALRRRRSATLALAVAAALVAAGGIPAAPVADCWVGRRSRRAIARRCADVRRARRAAARRARPDRGGRARALGTHCLPGARALPRAASAHYRAQKLGTESPLGAKVGATGFLRYSSNRLFGPSYEVAWYRGPVFALVEVQVADIEYREKAKVEAIRLARAQDARLARALAGTPAAPFRPRRIAGVDTATPEAVAVAWLRATAYRCTRDLRRARALGLPRATAAQPRPCAAGGETFRAASAATIGDTATIVVQITSVSDGVARPTVLSYSSPEPPKAGARTRRR